MQETAPDVISDTMRSIIPMTIKSFVPLDIFEKSHAEMFEMMLDGVLTNGYIKDKATQHLVVDSMLGCCRNEKHYAKILKWFDEGCIYNSLD